MEIPRADTRHFCGRHHLYSPLVEPAKTLLPLGSFTERALQVFELSFASQPSMVSWSPGLMELLLQPLRVNVLGGPPSHCQATTLPFWSFTSRYIQMCGLVHSSFVSVPWRVIGLSPLNSAANE